jgi:glycosyltransferase involved in cell wall biosynthesis
VEIVGHASESVVMLKNLQFFGLARIIGYICQKIAIYRVRKAVCASYTSCYLKRLYPTKTSTNEWVFSSVRLDKSVILGPKHTEQFNAKPFTIVSVGRVEPEKGHIVLIHAVEQLVHSGYNISLTIIGPGSEIDNLRKYVSEHGLSQQVTIYGPVPWGPDLFAEIDKACIFVLPSFTEGMPRALIEAMARGLPAIGSDVGGIKELLSEKYLVPPKDSKAIAAKIAEMIDDIPRLTMASNENFQKALEYRPEIMNQRKLAFWKCIKDTCRSK